VFYIICIVLHSTGEQEVRVLTLAEQIIAAMPERIKVGFISVMFKLPLQGEG
jgi:hypothetical protein